MADTDDKTSGEPRSRQSGSSAGNPWAFSVKALATTVGGSLLTLVVFLAQTTYSNHLEVLHRQDAQGIELQARILDLTGRIEIELSQILYLLRRAVDPHPTVSSQFLAEARTRLNGNLEPLYMQWRNERLLLRNRASQIYGLAVGDLTYSVADDAVEPNDCSVVTARGNTSCSADCIRQRREELLFLETLTHDIIARRSLEPFTVNTRLSTTFQANAAIARIVIQRYINCAEGGRDLLETTNCGNLPSLLEIAIQRVALVGFARANLADAIRTQSSLRQ